MDAVYRLPDGRRYVIRPIRRDDGPRLLSGFAQMSPRSRLLRFHTQREELNEWEIEHLVSCDGDYQIAVVASGIDDEGRENAEIGVARCYRTADDPSLAEVAFLVVDRWQGLGIGSRLLSNLADHCLRVGVTRWSAQVMAENEIAFRLLEGVGTVQSLQWAQGVAEMVLELEAR
ncbi:MAG: GNAT family N-acetyltransferase [Fimbriimonas sp.]